MKLTKASVNLLGKDHTATTLNSRKLATKDPTHYYCGFGREVYAINLATLGSSSTPTLVSAQEELVTQLPAPIECLNFLCTESSNYLYASDNSGIGKVMVYSPDNTVASSWDLRGSPSSVSGWSGIVPHPTDPTSTVIAKFYDKGVSLNEVDRIVREWKCVQHPTQVSYLPEKNLIVIVEYNHISLWDARSRAPAQRLSMASNEPLYGLSCLPHVIGVGGASRILSIFDTNTWKVRTHWKNCVKFEISSVNFSRSNPDYCYVNDDSVIVCDDWTTPNKNTRFYFTGGIRLDSSVIGVSQHTNSDTVAAFTENGTITVISNGISMTKEKRSVSEGDEDLDEGKNGDGGDNKKNDGKPVPPKKKRQKTS